MTKKLIFTVFFLLSFNCITAIELAAQTVKVRARVIDETTKEAIPFVQIKEMGSNNGTMTDMDGNFQLEVSSPQVKLRFQMVNYNALELVAGSIKSGSKIAMQAMSISLEEFQVHGRKGKQERYRRRNNAAVQLAEDVIAHKNLNRPERRNLYSRDVYEKIILAIDDFHPNFDSSRFWHRFDFIEKYIDQAPIDNTPILTVSMREAMMKQYYRRRPQRLRTLTVAKRMEGLDQMLDQNVVEANLSAMFSPIDIYDNDISFMLNHFVSPLSSAIATTFYHYYITDTTVREGVQCIELSFVPANKQSYGFTGQLYIVNDSSFALQGYNLTVSPHVNLNFARDITISQTYERDSSGMYLPTECRTNARLSIHPKLKAVYAHQLRLCSNYRFNSQAELPIDSLFNRLSNEAMLPTAKKMRRKEWNARRPIELTSKETLLDSLKSELGRLPIVKKVEKTADILGSGYVPTKASLRESAWDFGSIYNAVSFNNEEGLRLRIGGRTTPRLNPFNFADAYVAYGFGDKKLKYNATFTHTFDAKERSTHESPNSFISLTLSHDLETPGQSFDTYSRDNILMSTTEARKVQYVSQVSARMRKEWQSHISIDLRAAANHTEPAGSLEYQAYATDGTLSRVESFNDVELIGRMSFSPNVSAVGGYSAAASLLELKKDAPTITLSHRVGYIEGGFFFQRTDLSAEKRFWLGAFGHVDALLKYGVVWNQVPFPRLYIPNGNGSLFLSSTAFNTMQPMEFIMDQYVSLHSSYHMKGLILNYIPLIKRLKLREVVGFNFLYGGLSPKNDPANGYTGLYELPANTIPLGKVPYMEFSVGIENIFRFIHIDYVRRLTYVDALSKSERGCIRMELRFSL